MNKTEMLKKVTALRAALYERYQVESSSHKSNAVTLAKMADALEGADEVINELTPAPTVSRGAHATANPETADRSDAPN